MKSQFYVYYSLGVLTLVGALILYSGIKSIFQPTIRDVLSAQTKTTQEIHALKQEVNKLQTKDQAYTKALQDVGKLTQEVLLLRSQLQAKTPTGLPPATQSGILTTGRITIKNSQWKYVDVYQIRSASSKVVGKATYGKNYEFIDKDGDYYLIMLSPELYGWIRAQFVKEVSAKLSD